MLPMQQTTSAAYGMYSRNSALPDVVHSLNRAGFENQDICMVLAPTHPAASLVRDANLLHGERETSASTRLIGWFSQFGAVMIPTIGFFMRSQMFIQALLADQSSSASCGESRTLMGLGFSEDEANRLGQRLDDVEALIYVACKESKRASRASELLRSAGAREAASLEPAKAMHAVA
jgi:hypothetical protein